MPKGRNFAPATKRDGVWFAHRGMGPFRWPPLSETHTSTGQMLSAPFHEFTAAYPPKPPQPYSEKQRAKNFKLANDFSEHDNRHVLQECGEYLGDGRDLRHLGKRLHSCDERLHFTNKEYLKHHGRQITNYDYRTQYDSTYQGEKTKTPPVHRRFPRIHPDGDEANSKLDTTTTDWFKQPEVAFKTPLQVLASSQEPFLPNNSWKYSNHGLSRCYPPYDHIKKTKTFSTWVIRGKEHQEQTVKG